MKSNIIISTNEEKSPWIEKYLNNTDSKMTPRNLTKANRRMRIIRKLNTVCRGKSPNPK